MGNAESLDKPKNIIEISDSDNENDTEAQPRPGSITQKTAEKIVDNLNVNVDNKNIINKDVSKIPENTKEAVHESINIDSDDDVEMRPIVTSDLSKMPVENKNDDPATIDIEKTKEKESTDEVIKSNKDNEPPWIGALKRDIMTIEDKNEVLTVNEKSKETETNDNIIIESDDDNETPAISTIEKKSEIDDTNNIVIDSDDDNEPPASEATESKKVPIDIENETSTIEAKPKEDDTNNIVIDSDDDNEPAASVPTEDKKVTIDNKNETSTIEGEPKEDDGNSIVIESDNDVEPPASVASEDNKGTIDNKNETSTIEEKPKEDDTNNIVIESDNENEPPTDVATQGNMEIIDNKNESSTIGEKLKDNDADNIVIESDEDNEGPIEILASESNKMSVDNKIEILTNKPEVDNTTNIVIESDDEIKAPTIVTTKKVPMENKIIENPEKNVVVAEEPTNVEIEQKSEMTDQMEVVKIIEVVDSMETDESKLEDKKQEEPELAAMETDDEKTAEKTNILDEQNDSDKTIEYIDDLKPSSNETTGQNDSDKTIEYMDVNNENDSHDSNKTIECPEGKKTSSDHEDTEKSNGDDVEMSETTDEIISKIIGEDKEKADLILKSEVQNVSDKLGSDNVADNLSLDQQEDIDKPKNTEEVIDLEGDEIFETPSTDEKNEAAVVEKVDAGNDTAISDQNQNNVEKESSDEITKEAEEAGQEVVILECDDPKNEQEPSKIINEEAPDKGKETPIDATKEISSEAPKLEGYQDTNIVMEINPPNDDDVIIDLDFENDDGEGMTVNEDDDGEAKNIGADDLAKDAPYLQIKHNLEIMQISTQQTTTDMEIDVDTDEIVFLETSEIESNSIQIISNKKEETRDEKTEKAHNEMDTACNAFQECINHYCNKSSTVFFPAPIFVLSFYRINKKSNKKQLICEKCYDDAIDQYEVLCGNLIDQVPISFKTKMQPDLIELSDSDDEAQDGDKKGVSNLKNPNRRQNFIEDNESNRKVLDNLESLIEETFSRINIDMQLNHRTNIISSTIKANEDAATALMNEMRELQKNADKMHYTLYQRNPSRQIKELPALDLNKEDSLNLPPIGDIKYPPLQIGKLYLAPRHATSGAWVLCEALEMHQNHPTDLRKRGVHYKVLFCRRSTKLVLSIKHIAYSSPPDVRLPVGTRVVAIFQQVPVPKQSFFPGTVGEALMDSNKYRYLIFFDDGYCQYVTHTNVRLICEVSSNVWEDIDGGNLGTSKFIQEYLAQYNNRTPRPMIQAKRGQKIVTEFNGIWKLSRIVDVDCNLIKIYIEKNQTFEWIYRGSSRFAPIFKHRQIGSDLQLNAINYHLKKRNEPYIEMTIDLDADDNNQSTTNDGNNAVPAGSEPKGTTVTATRAVARKSTNVNRGNGSMNKAPVSLNNSVIVVDDDKMPKGKVTYYETTKRYSSKKYNSHTCNPSCLMKVEDNLEPFNPIARPLLSGWERQICKTRSRKIAIYRAPCGRRLRNMLEVHRYLRLTNSPLNVECFDYDTTMHCLAEYTDLPQYIRNTDLSDGTEKMPISCCNYFDSTTPPSCRYSTNRIPTEGVNLNLNPDFLCGCDCEDDCIDKSKCQCWQLTLKGARCINTKAVDDEVGYCFKRLLNPVPTGIYECNPRCKCNQTCLNRVVQHPLSVKLQVFKTTNRGWGLRTLHDIPKGSFICIYAGDLLTEQSSNELGAKEGDEYFAELDYIEAVEGLKEGYESDIPRDDADDEQFGDKDDDFENSADSDDDNYTSKCKAIQKKIATRSSTRTAKNHDKDNKKSGNSNRSSITTAASASSIADDDDCITISDDEEIRAPVNFIPNTSYDDDTEVDSKYKSVRKLFGRDELGYVMDAKRTGNIGRYFNHSCNPNLFVQNVFVDTHDLRFPWVTFFSNTSIQAGTELTWNYNYDVGCVPGKVLYCQCASFNCRGRLL